MRTRPVHHMCGKLVMCDECRFWDWCEMVVAILVNHARVRGKLETECNQEFMQRCRGDEPWTSFAIGETPEQYAQFLMIPSDDGDSGYLEEVEL